MPKKAASQCFRPKKRERAYRDRRKNRNQDTEQSTDQGPENSPSRPESALSSASNSDTPRRPDSATSYVSNSDSLALSDCASSCSSQFIGTPLSDGNISDGSLLSPCSMQCYGNLSSPALDENNSDQSLFKTPTPSSTTNNRSIMSPTSDAVFPETDQSLSLSPAPSSTKNNASSVLPQTSDAVSSETEQLATEILSYEECKELLLEMSQKVALFLPGWWIALVSEDCLNVMCLSRKREKAIQRRLCFGVDGETTLSVHGKAIDISPYLNGLTSPGALKKTNVDNYVDFIASLVATVRLHEICSGADDAEYKEAWSSYPNSYVDKDFFKECRYVETLRESTCKMLVDQRIWRCTECNKTADRLRRKIVSLQKEADPSTANIYLSDAQSKKKIKNLTKANEAKQKKIDRLKNKMALLIKNEGMLVDDNLGELMTAAVESQDLTATESLFFQQQLKAIGCKSKRGMRWHPHMIRFALSIFLSSPSTYNIIRESGLIRLPHERTLFDYSHVFEDKEGVCMPVIQSVIDGLKPGEKFKWHVLLCDEMHISKNIVYHKSSGKIMGYVTLLPVEKALQELKNYLDNVEDAVPTMASKVLSFMIKGVCSSVKEVVASFSIDQLNREKMYTLTWNLICTLERSGIQVICITSDGNAVNRAFFKMNTPITPTKSGVVFDTPNKAAPSRPLFFMSDVPHIMKTIRNNFYNSRSGKKTKRCLTKNGQTIVWSTIIRLFNAKKGKNLRKSYKLNHANVFPDSYSCMKVGYAFQVLSKTVGTDLDAQQWPGTSETVKFILLVNDVGDCLNGAHTSSGIRKANPLLEPYRRPDDPRFCKYLEGFLDYLDEWKNEVTAAADRSQSILNQTVGPDDSFHSLHDLHEEAAAAENSPPAHKKLLCHQTLEGIEIAIKGFMGAVKYLLEFGGVNFVNARVFCQDPLEQFFSKQRAKGGSSTAPNVQKFYANARAIHIQRGLGANKRKGNTEIENSPAEICDEKLPKRRKGPTL